MLFNHPELKKIFPEPPMAALKQGPNLRKYLCRAKLSKARRISKFKRSCHQNSEGWKKCSKPCPICPFAAQNTAEVNSLVSDYSHKIYAPPTPTYPRKVFCPTSSN